MVSPVRYRPKPWWFPAPSMWTTLGTTIWHPSNIDPLHPSRADIRVHELIHVDQQVRWTVPVFLVCYLLLPLPFGLSWFRWRWEREAYMTQIKNEDGIEPIVQLLGGFAYGWSWPRSLMRRWFLREIRTRG